MLEWLEQELKVSSKEFRKLKAVPVKLEALRPRPTLTVAQANVAALKEVLHMSTPQVLSAELWCTCVCFWQTTHPALQCVLCLQSSV